MEVNISTIAKSIFGLNVLGIFEIIFMPEFLLDILGMLEYMEPAGYKEMSNQEIAAIDFSERPKHRDYICEKVKFRQVLDMTRRKDFEVNLLIHFGVLYKEESKIDKSDNRTFITKEEIRRLAKALSELGVSKIRITGGEPTVRKDFLDIIKIIKKNYMNKIKR